MPNLNLNPECNPALELIGAVVHGGEGDIAIVRIEEGRVTDTRRCKNPHGAADAVLELNAKPGGSVYYQIATVRSDASRRTERDLCSVAAVGIDIDGGHGKADAALLTIFERALDLGEPEESAVVRTSNEGTQILWLLDEPLDLTRPENVERFKAIMTGLAARYDGDRNATLATQLFRVPGTWNSLNAKKRAQGREPAPCTTERLDPDRRYSIEAFADVEAEGRTIRASRVGSVNVAEADWPEWDDEEPEWLLDLRAQSEMFERRFTRDVDETDDSAIDFVVGLHTYRVTKDVEKAYVACKASRTLYFGDEKCERDGYFRLTALKVRDVVERERKEALALLPDDLDPSIAALRVRTKPVILLSGKQQDDIANEVIDAIVAANDPQRLFRHAGGVTLVHRNEEGVVVPRRQNVERFRQVSAEAAVYERRIRMPNGHFQRVHAKLAREDASVALERLTIRDDLSALRGIATNPIMRGDGTILCEPGYDPQTQLYADLEGRRLEVPERPTRSDVETAAALWRDLLFDFPFVDDGSRAHAIALPLSLAMREEILGPVPATAVDAPCPATGKSLLARTVIAPVKGRLPAAMTELPGNEEEMRKRITSILRLGSDFVFVDNLDHPLRSGTLSMLLTETEWTDRVLGVSEMVSIANRTVWCVTGNNLAIEGDLIRRFVWIRLDAKLARPDKRPEDGFRHRLPDWALDRRDDLLSALFTLCRAWIQAGRPEPTGIPTFGSYERWTHVVGGILEVAEIPGFLANRDELWEAMDQEGPCWGAFLAALHAQYGGGTFTSADVKALADGPDRDEIPLPDGLPESYHGEFAKALGKELRARTGRRFAHAGGGEVWIERTGTGTGGVVKWRVHRKTQG